MHSKDYTASYPVADSIDILAQKTREVKYLQKICLRKIALNKLQEDCIISALRKKVISFKSDLQLFFSCREFVRL